ncbi:condensation domain-containing protein [Streptomyces sp. M19]
MSAEERDRLPLTSPQAGIWVAQQLDPELRLPHRRIPGNPRRDRSGIFQEALRIMIAESECLNVRFEEEDGRVWQVPRRMPPLELEVVDVSDHADPGAVAREHMRAVLAEPTDLLDRHLLLRGGPERFYWLHAPTTSSSTASPAPS